MEIFEGGCHSAWLHCEFLSLYKKLSLSLPPSLSIIRSVQRREALNKQPVELSQLEPFSIITSRTILHLHCIYLAGGLDNVAKKRVTLAADDNN